ncbi:hypothetical protein O181_093297 [Austropuccinia psidii MF-1]|uniref:Uncharacterized protein n=1 Tax=Austropuccinia psidii MF-1 TaxID=1389203 RepID=A0A9Q3PAD6_9BASI|nr:hypothetical protein [Austropuccinia psidii MF-1]
MQEGLLELLKKEGKRKSSSFNPQEIPIHKDMPLPRSFRQECSLSFYEKFMATSTTFTEKRPKTLPISVKITRQIPIPLNKEILRNKNPIFKISAKYYSLWLYGKDVEIFLQKFGKIEKIEGASGSDIARQMKFWTKDEDISYHIEEF